MLKRISTLFLLLAGLCAIVSTAYAHPHVWVTVRSELVYADDGSITAIRHRWTFDDMFSAFATQGLKKNEQGNVAAEELASLAEVNVTSLKEFDFFSQAKINGRKSPFDTPKDYYLVQDKDVLTLHFTLPFKSPQKAQKLDLEIYDPAYFVAFALADDNPMVLVGAPPKCELTLARPAADATAAGQRLSEAFFNSPDGASNYGAQFANKVAVKCP